MSDSQNFKKRLLPIKTIKQLAESFLIAEVIVELRKEIEEDTQKKAIDSIPKIEVPISKELEELYIEACQIAKFKPVLVYIMKFAIEDMITYNFSEDPSVIVAVSNDTTHLQQQFGQSFSTLSKVNLLDHTVNVFKEAVTASKSRGRATGVVIPMIASLLHDFGKSSGIRKEILGEAGNSRGYKAHAEVSASYIQEKISIKLYNKFNEMATDTTDLLAHIVKNHHAQNMKSKNDSNISLVIEADQKARKKEYKNLLAKKAEKEK
jgi:hypothetical protein